MERYVHCGNSEERHIDLSIIYYMKQFFFYFLNFLTVIVIHGLTNLYLNEDKPVDLLFPWPLSASVCTKAINELEHLQGVTYSLIMQMNVNYLLT